ncbi:MAG: hypothetical protein J3Q66DRAFT_330616 [Benniella sp.]|nr:MAG: hypothetical protein J3Q66DRAFT_330616 [Benniella sp.]
MDDREQNSSVIKAVLRGCARRIGLKSIFIFGYDIELDTDSSCGLVETLVKYHSETLESVEFQAWNYHYRPFQLDQIFTDCQNLKSFKASRNEETMHNWMWFFHLPQYQWFFYGLKELYLHFHQYELYSDSVDMTRAELEAGEVMFKLIADLIHLEVLALDFRYHRYETAACWGFDDAIEDKWVRKLAGLDKLRYVSMPLECWSEGNLSKIIDSRWPRLERVSSRDLRQESRTGEDSTFHWLKKRRPWLTIGDLE